MIMLLIYIQPMPSIALERVPDVSHVGLGWMHPISNYLNTNEVSENGKQLYNLCIQIVRLSFINDHLYRQLFRWLYLKCPIDSETQYVLAKLHESVCDNHPGGWDLVHRAYSQGYYWPTLKRDAKNYIHICDQCQKHALIPRLSSNYLNP